MWITRLYRPLLAAAIIGLIGVEASSQSRGPLSSIQVVESAVIRTPSHRVHSSSHFDLEFDIKDRRQRVKLVLEPNHDIIPHNAGISFLDADGEVEYWEPIDRTQHRIFKGSAWLKTGENTWDQMGWSRVSILQDGSEPVFEGSFSIMHDSHHIQLRHKFEQTRHGDDPITESAGEGSMILFRDSDTFGHPWHGDLRKRDQHVLACSADHLNFNADPFHPINRPFGQGLDFNSENITLAARQIDGSNQPSGNAGSVNYRNTIGQTAGCPTARKVALVGVAVDCTYRSGFSNKNDTTAHVIGVMNQASQVYEATFNITLGLKNLTIQEPDCPASAQTATPWNLGCDSSLNISSRLNTFSAWRGQFQDNNAYWMLLTNCTTGPEVGLSWLGQLCVKAVSTAGGESTSGANVVARTSTEWQVIAHETGHMFGAVHDCDSSTCASTAASAQQCCPLSTSTCDANSQFIMNPSTGMNIQAFSACTIGNICGAMLRKSVDNTCLVDNRGVPELITAQQCGNGIVEGDEECDCGGTAGCQGNNCCDPTTCKFINNAVCDESNEPCCSGCQFATNGTICRASTGVCDPQEVCSGSSATCPADVTAPDGQDCGNSLQCASGQCTSRDQQCQTMMGSLTTSNDTRACTNDPSTCTLSCTSPQFNGGCYSMQQYFLDGTPCGSGTCKNGVCQGDSVGGDIAQWFKNNKTLAIGLGAGIGGLLVICILICCVRCCRRPRRQPLRKRVVSPSMQQWPGVAGVYGPQSAPPRYGGSPAHGPYSVPAPNIPGYGGYTEEPRGPIQRNTFDAPVTPGLRHEDSSRGSMVNRDSRQQSMFYHGNSVRYA